ncbi:MAG: phospholipase/carboxylesterase, partial [bacterium]
MVVMANQELLPCVEINPKETPDSAVIWLHGLGADGYDFQPIVPELELPESLNTRFIFPHAQMRPVTINGGMSMRAWYDILDIQIDRVIDLEHIQESSDQIQALIQRELDAGIPANRIILAGFSQGGAVAIHTALRYEHTLAGLLALSTYMPTSESLEKEKHQANLAIPIMMGHGT